MNTVPVVFAIDDNVVMQCGITITSMIVNAHEDTEYEINVLYDSDKLSNESRFLLQDSFNGSEQVKLTFWDVKGLFNNLEADVSGHVTLATYYRLAIPDIIPQFDKVIYADIDMIFQQDLSDVYQHSLQKGELVAAVRDLAINEDHYFHSDMPAKIGKSEKDYFNAGFLVMNLKQMREEHVSDAFREHIKIQYDQNDQDILNIVCNGRVQFLPSLYNFQLNHFSNYMWGREKSEISFRELLNKATLHYTWKNKPWNSLECIGADTWWYYYKRSPFYDDKVYFLHQQAQIEVCRNDYHRRTNVQLIKRILANWKHKILG